MKKFHLIVAGIAFIIFSAAAAHATTYYVKADGNDNLDGRSDKTAWRTIRKVNNFKFNTGDDVYFKCGDSWTATDDSTWLRVHWAGHSTNHTTVGAYYMRNSKETIGVNQEGKPVIDGGSAYPTKGYPSDVNGGLILVSYRNYVDVENFTVQNSFASGVRFTHSDYGSATNIDLDYIRGSGITFVHSNHGLVENCEARRIGTGWKYFGDRDWGIAFGGQTGSQYITVQNSKAYECWTEGIGFYKGSNYGVADSNIVWGVQKVGIYVCESTNCTISNNIVYGTKDESFHRGGGYVGAGIYISHEKRTSNYVHTTRVYGNVIARTSHGLRIGCDTSLSVFKNSEIYNNTFVDNGKGVFFYGSLFKNSSFRNNIIWNPNGGKILDQYGNGGFSGLTFSNNCWYPSPYISTGSTDFSEDPMLIKQLGWKNLSGDDINFSHFDLQKDSPIIDKNIGAMAIDHPDVLVSPPILKIIIKGS